MESSAPVLHDAILLAIGIAAVYLVVALLQLIQLRSAHAKSARHVREPSFSHPAPRNETIPVEEESFAARLQQSNTEAMLKRLESEVERLGAELQALRDAAAEKNTAPSKALTGPAHYNEAMAFARHGMSAAGIAIKCNISLGEAELVLALVRGDNDTAMSQNTYSAPLTPAPQHHDGYRAAA